jgi:predicted nuclease with TOPRIM domain
LDTSSPSRAIADNLALAQTNARLQSTIEEQVDVNLSLKVAVTRLESAKEELEGDVEYYKEKYSNLVKNKLDKANETNERLKLENENLKRQLRGMNSSSTSSQRIELSLPSPSSQASASLSANRKRSVGEIN